MSQWFSPSTQNTGVVLSSGLDHNYKLAFMSSISVYNSYVLTFKLIIVTMHLLCSHMFLHSTYIYKILQYSVIIDVITEMNC
jgi:hypothetical protein